MLLNSSNFFCREIPKIIFSATDRIIVSPIVLPYRLQEQFFSMTIIEDIKTITRKSEYVFSFQDPCRDIFPSCN